MTKEEKLKKGQKLAEKAVFLEGALALTKGVIGVLSGSIVLISDAIHSGSDVLSIITSWFGLRLARKRPDERFPYGYYKAENLGTLIVSSLILYASWQMLTSGFERLFSVSPIRIPLLALGISFSDALILFFFGKYEIKVGRQINAQSLIAMGQENKTHLFSSMAVFMGILAASYQIPYIEGILTIVIAFMILKIGVEAARDSLFALMDVSPGKEIEKKTVQVIEAIPGIEEAFSLRLRKSGPFVFGEVCVGIRKFVNVSRAHEIADRVEKEVARKVPQIDSLSIHIEPFKSDYQHLVIPVKKRKSLNSEVAESFGRAPHFLFINLKGKKLKSFYFLKNPYQEKKVRAGLAAAKLIVRQKIDVLITFEIGEIAFHTLRNNLVDIYQTEEKKAKEVMEKFNKGELKKLEKPTRKIT